LKEILRSPTADATRDIGATRNTTESRHQKETATDPSPNPHRTSASRFRKCQKQIAGGNAGRTRRTIRHHGASEGNKPKGSREKKPKHHGEQPTTQSEGTDRIEAVNKQKVPLCHLKRGSTRAKRRGTGGQGSGKKRSGSCRKG